MISPFRISPPQNWQDFELLTLKLFGEIWKVPNEIEFNSESGSNQKGVDIYCIPKNEKGYYGIQCKNKKLFCKYGQLNKLKKTTIQVEIEKAKEFSPRLEMLVIATSFSKDVDLEEYVRKINLNHINNGLFRVQICFWDYFSRKIVEFENINNWYLRNQNFEKRKSVFVSFQNDNTIFSASPKFIKNHVTYRLETKEEKEKELEKIHKVLKELRSHNKTNLLGRIFNKKNTIEDDIDYPKIFINGIDTTSQEYLESTYPRLKEDDNKKPNIFSNLIEDEQEFSFQIKIRNNGSSVIEDFKLTFEIDGDFKSIDVATPRISQLKTYKPTTWINNNLGLIESNEKFIIQKDHFLSKPIIITPKLALKNEIKIKWTLLARDFNDEGELTIKVEPKFLNRKKTMYVLKAEDCREVIEFDYQMEERNYQINF